MCMCVDGYEGASKCIDKMRKDCFTRVEIAARIMVHGDDAEEARV